ncbi:MAG: type II toxin-antitoxin system VapC family toxin [Candidatus Kuenenia sp.]|nr:type II toxin-antitoxin system VapC family toxin [Candidatus Kuenenia hertensis]
MILYLDTSDLVKLYVAEDGSEKVKNFVSTATVVSTSKVAYAEARAAFARKQKDDGFPLRILRKIVADFNRDWENYFVIEITDGLVQLAGNIAEKYLLRGGDSIHLASAVNLKNKIRSDVYFSSNDTKLNNAAEKEGICLRNS